MNRDDVWMVQRCDGPSFALEARASSRICRRVRWQGLESHDSTESGVAGRVNVAHAAGAEQCGDFIGTEASASRQRHQMKAGLYGAGVSRRVGQSSLGAGRLATSTGAACCWRQTVERGDVRFSGGHRPADAPTRSRRRSVAGVTDSTPVEERCPAARQRAGDGSMPCLFSNTPDCTARG